MPMRRATTVWFATVLVALACCETRRKADDRSRAEARDAAVAAVAARDAATAAQAPADAATPLPLTATGPCKLGEPVIFCGTRWAPDTTSIACENAEVTDLQPLSCLPKLTHIDLAGTSVSDLSPLAGIEQLQLLELGNTKVVDLGPLVGKQIEHLGLRGTAIRDLKVAGKIAPGELDIRDTALSDEQIARAKGLSGVGVAGTPPPEIKEFDCEDNMNHSLREHDGETLAWGADEETGFRKQVEVGVTCSAVIAAGCDGKLTATLRRNGRKVDARRAETAAAGSTEVEFPTGWWQLKWEQPYVIALDVDIRCGQTRKKLRDRFATTLEKEWIGDSDDY